MKVHIVEGNSKLGNTPNISTMPGLDCGKDVPCRKDCYAQKFLWRPSVKKAWSENSKMQRRHPDEYFRQITDYLDKKRPKWFRIHVAGDFINQHTLNEWKIIASWYSGTRFLAFTKRPDLNFGGMPQNLNIRISMWPGWSPPHTMGYLRHPWSPWSFFWMQDKLGNETRIPKRAFECPGACETCRACWSKVPRDVVVMKH
jgi:hypothetical protein